jgi:hypothetical protein
MRICEQVIQASKIFAAVELDFNPAGGTGLLGDDTNLRAKATPEFGFSGSKIWIDLVDLRRDARLLLSIEAPDPIFGLSH